MRAIVITIALLGLSGCVTVPTFTKAEIAQKHSSKTFVKKGNYLNLAQYWDDNAEKYMIDFKGASFLTVWEKARKAEITLGNGPYYGLIELTYIDENTTQVTVFAWGGDASSIRKWADLIRHAPESKGVDQKGQKGSSSDISKEESGSTRILISESPGQAYRLRRVSPGRNKFDPVASTHPGGIRLIDLDKCSHLR